MGLLSRVEQTIERLIEGSAFRFFGGDLQPVEIAKRLARVMESQREIGPHGLSAPTQYGVRLSSTDYERFAPRRASFERDRADYLIQAASQRGLRLDRRPTVVLAREEGLARHAVRIDARHADDDARTIASTKDGHTRRLWVTPSGARPTDAPPRIHLLDPNAPSPIVVDHLPFSIGRSLDNDLPIADRRVSRHHALIKEIAGEVCLVDLDSTNGTSVNGEPIRQSVLADADTISLGGYPLTVALGSRT